MPDQSSARIRAGFLQALLVLSIFSFGDLAAQTWQGPAAVEVVVTHGGKPVVEAQVVLRYAEFDPPLGPSAVPTDQRGRALVQGLAEGQWFIEVTHESFMSYSAVLTVRRGKKPVPSSVSLIKSGSALTPMRVKFLKAPEAPATPEALSTPFPSPPGPTEGATPAPSPRVAASPPVRPAPAAEPPAEPSTPATAAEPSFKLRSYYHRTCFECRPGEWALSLEQKASAGASPSREASCPQDLQAKLQQALDILAQIEITGNVAAVPLAQAASGGAGAAVDEQTAAVLGELLTSIANRDSSCQVVALLLPRGARYIGYLYEAWDGLGTGICPPGEPCAVGSCQWQANPVVEPKSFGTVVYGVFRNWSREWERTARLTVYFSPPHSD